MNSHSLVDLSFARCLPFWGGEFDVALRYFSPGTVGRTLERERAWLEFQILKEWFGSGVYGPRCVTVEDVLRAALDRVRLPTKPGLDEASALEEASATLRFGVDEFAHFTCLFKLWRDLYPRERADVPSWGALPTGKALTELRYQLREEPLGEVAVRLSEGGGLGLFFGIQASLAEATKGFDRALLRAVQRILADERGHLINNFVWASSRLREPGEIDRVVVLLEEISSVKLQEREAQFGVHLGEGSAREPMERYREGYLSPMRDEILARINAEG